MTSATSGLDSLLGDLLAEDLHAAGAIALPRPSSVPDVAALNSEAISVARLQERAIARARDTVRPSRREVAA